MKVIITGGTGLIGSALVRSLIKDGHQAVVLTRNPKKKVDGLPGVRLVKWDGKSGDGWYEEVESADVVVNMAGESIAPQAGRWNTERKRRIKQSRIDASRAVVDAIRRATNKPEVLIQGSAVGFYGVHDDERITEDAPAGNDFLAEVVKEWEQASEPVEAMGGSSRFGSHWSCASSRRRIVAGFGFAFQTLCRWSCWQRTSIFTLDSHE